MSTVINPAKLAASSTLRYALLHGRHPVLIELVEFVRLQLDGVFWTLSPRKPYTAGQLIGTALWASLSFRERMLIGSVISHLVTIGELPLLKVSKRSRWASNSYVMDLS